MQDEASLLTLSCLCKAYAAPVLLDVSLDLRAGEVHALVGENGAGKTTLARIASGLTRADRGTMRLHGQPYAPASKHDAERRGVRMVMQELNLIPNLSVAENIFLGRLPHCWSVVSTRRLHAAAREAMARVGLEGVPPDRPVWALGVGQQQLVEIAAGLSGRTDLLILDEPTAALTDAEVELLFGQIRRLKAAGAAILYISHRMEEIFRIADRITVLRDGRVVGTRIVGGIVGGTSQSRDSVGGMSPSREGLGGSATQEPGPASRETRPGTVALSRESATVRPPRSSRREDAPPTTSGESTTQQRGTASRDTRPGTVALSRESATVRPSPSPRPGDTPPTGDVVPTGDAPPTSQVTLDEIIRLMVGRDLGEVQRPASERAGAVALRVVGLSRGDAPRDVSFEAREGEILGLAGLMGSGRTETLRALFGADRPDAGQIFLRGSGQPARIRSPRDAVRLGIALLTEDRKQQGLLLPLPIRSNVTLARLEALAGLGGVLRGGEERRVAEGLADQLGLQCRSVEQPVAELSGGNQQKVVMAKWLYRDCRVLLLDEPTRGIDVGAKFAIYRLLADLAERGKAIVMASSDLLELLAVCDRIAVMSAGRLVATFARGEATQDGIMEAALSGYAGSKARAS